MARNVRNRPSPAAMAIARAAVEEIEAAVIAPVAIDPAPSLALSITSTMDTVDHFIANVIALHGNDKVAEERAIAEGAFAIGKASEDMQEQSKQMLMYVIMRRQERKFRDMANDPSLKTFAMLRIEPDAFNDEVDSLSLQFTGFATVPPGERNKPNPEAKAFAKSIDSKRRMLRAALETVIAFDYFKLDSLAYNMDHGHYQVSPVALCKKGYRPGRAMEEAGLIALDYTHGNLIERANKEDTKLLPYDIVTASPVTVQDAAESHGMARIKTKTGRQPQQQSGDPNGGNPPAGGTTQPQASASTAQSQTSAGNTTPPVVATPPVDSKKANITVHSLRDLLVQAVAVMEQRMDKAKSAGHVATLSAPHFTTRETDAMQRFIKAHDQLSHNTVQVQIEQEEKKAATLAANKARNAEIVAERDAQANVKHADIPLVTTEDNATPPAAVA